jgi:hypothetical protein
MLYSTARDRGEFMRVLMALFLFPAFLLADRLPDNLIIQGKAETVLCGIDVTNSHDSDLLKRFGKPVIYLKYPQTVVDAAEITWNVEGSKIHVYINGDYIAYAVEVSGKASAITKTGRGLALGQTVTDLERIYGKKYRRRGSRITLQWEDETELRIKIANGLIVSIELVLSQA